jgi:hypothetical protein
MSIAETTTDRTSPLVQFVDWLRRGERRTIDAFNDEECRDDFDS